MHRFSFDEKRLEPNAIIGFALGIAASYIVQCRLPVFSSILGCIGGGFSAAEIIRVLIVVGVGGLWYSFRNVV